MEIMRKKIERLVITGSLDEYREAHAYCQENGFRIIQTNPCLSGGKQRNRVNSFEIVAEKEFKGV
jgi:hypothetical protein